MSSSNIDGKALFLTLPSRLWHVYVDLLWDPPRGSWVDRSAKTFRVLAFLVMFPFVVLTLLDVMSYIVARTLGVVETTRASTNDKRVALAVPYVTSGAAAANTAGDDRVCANTELEPRLVVEFVDRELQLSSQEPSRSPSAADLTAESLSATPTMMRITSTSGSSREENGRPSARVSILEQLEKKKYTPLPLASMDNSSSVKAQMGQFKEKQTSPPMPDIQAFEPETYFFNPSDEISLELSGANLLSPAASRDVSPSVERRRLQLTPLDSDRDVNSTPLGSDTDSSSFILLEQHFDGTPSSSPADSKLRRRIGESSSAADNHGRSRD